MALARFVALLSGDGVTPGSFDPLNKGANIALSNGNRTTTNASGTYDSAKSVLSKTSRKFYVEVVFGSANTGGEFGVSKAAFSVTGTEAAADAATAVAANGQTQSVWIGGVAQASSNIAGGNAPATNDRWDMALDLDNDRIWFRRNGGVWNTSGLANPASNTGGYDISTWRAGAAVYLTCCSAHVTIDAVYTWNFGYDQYLGTPPAGFGSWGTP